MNSLSSSPSQLTNPSPPQSQINLNSRSQQSLRKRIIAAVIIGLIFLIGFGVYIYALISKPDQLMQPASASPGASVIVNKSAGGPNTLETSKDTKIAIQLTVESTASGQIKGKLDLKNLGEQSLTDVYYDAFLRAPNTQEKREINGEERSISVQGALISSFESKGFSLISGESKSLEIVVPYTELINPDNYALQIALFQKDNKALAGTSANVDLKGTGQLLESDSGSCKIVVNGKDEYDPSSGPNTSESDNVLAKCKYTNRSNKAIDVTARIDYSERFVVSYPQSEKFHLEVNEPNHFDPNQTKEIIIKLPKLSKPQTYQAMVTLLKTGDNQQAAPSTFFRWVITGPSANITTLSLDKDYYQQGQKATVSVLAAPSMDLYWRNSEEFPAEKSGTDLLNPKLSVTISSKSEICGQTEIDLPKITGSNTSWSDQKIEMDILKECKNPKVEAKISNDGQVLAQTSYEQVSTPNPAYREMPLKSLMIPVGIGVFLIVVFMLILVALFTDKFMKKTLVVVLFILGSLIFLQQQSWVKAYNIINPGNTLAADGNNWKGTFWLNGSSITRNANGTLTVAFVGQVYGNGCANAIVGYSMHNQVTGHNNLTITYNSGNHGLAQNIGSDLLVSVGNNSGDWLFLTYTLSSASGPIASYYDFQLNVDLWTNVWSQPPFDRFSSNPATWVNGNPNESYCQNVGCMGRVSQSIPAPTVSLSNTSNTCAAKPNSTLNFNFSSSNPGIITTYYLDKNGVNIASTPVGTPNVSVSIPENDTSSYTARAQTTSGIVSGATPVNVTAAPCPYGQFAPVATCGNIRVSWQPFATADHYRVIYSNQSTGATTTVPTPPASTTNAFLDITAANGLTVGTPYAFIVAAYNASDTLLRYSNEGNWSNSYYPNTTFPDCRKPLPFVQNAPVSACGSITANWNLAGGPTATYQVRYLNSVGAPDTMSASLGTVNTAALTAAAPWNLQVGNYYTTLILATNPYGSTWSDEVAGNPTWYVNKPGGFWSIFPNCAAPAVVIRINNQVSTVTPNVQVNQNSSAVIDWSVTNSPTSTVSSNPVNAAWNASGSTLAGSMGIDTSIPGTYSFTRQGTNSFTGATDSKTITLIVVQYPRPFIQTTGGDIHTNETINITPNNP